MARKGISALLIPAELQPGALGLSHLGLAHCFAGLHTAPLQQKPKLVTRNTKYAPAQTPHMLLRAVSVCIFC